MEILITSIIVLLAGYIIFKNIRNSAKGNCSCKSCSSNCPVNKNKETILIKNKTNENA